MNIITTEHAPAAIGTYSQAVIYGDILYVSGQIGLDPKTGVFVSDDFRAQTKQAFENVLAIIVAAQTSKNRVIKLNVSLTDMNHFSVFNEVMPDYFCEPYPARAVVAVKELPKQALIEIEAIVGMRDAM